MLDTGLPIMKIIRFIGNVLIFLSVPGKRVEAWQELRIKGRCHFICTLTIICGVVPIPIDLLTDLLASELPNMTYYLVALAFRLVCASILAPSVWYFGERKYAHIENKTSPRSLPYS